MWQITVPPTPASEFEAAVDAAQPSFADEPITDPSPQVQEQIDNARKAAKALVASGAVGDFVGGHEFEASLSGHANPDHLPVDGGDGGPTDSLSVTVHQAQTAQGLAAIDDRETEQAAALAAAGDVPED